jgi:hypothetical protein
LERAVATLETERIKGSNPWCLWWWWRTLRTMEICFHYFDAIWFKKFRTNWTLYWVLLHTHFLLPFVNRTSQLDISFIYTIRLQRKVKSEYGAARYCV